MTSTERQERRTKLMQDIAAFHRRRRSKESTQLPGQLENREDLDECTRIIREKAAVNLSEKDELHAIHVLSYQPASGQ